LVGLTAYLLLGRWNNWQIPLILMFTHFIIDLLKINIQKNQLLGFILDQFLHLLIILACWIGLTDALQEKIDPILTSWFTDQKVWLIILGYLINTKPLSLLIGYITTTFRKQMDDDNGSLSKAGEWIGMLERILVFTFVSGFSVCRNVSLSSLCRKHPNLHL